jgi:hypothetical protein
MADFLGNFLSSVIQNVPYLKDRNISPEVMLGVSMHLLLIVCFIGLFGLLVMKFM